MPELHPAPINQKFCTQCGSELTHMIPPGDNRVRDVCLNCGAVHYRNPLVVAGTLTIYEGKVLLCKRGIEPRYGKWTLPAGFLELEEGSTEGAIRETMEEASAKVNIKGLFTVIDVPYVSQVHIMYLADLLDIDFNPCEETLEIGFFEQDEIPWDELAFGTVYTTLKHYFLPETQNALADGLIPTAKFSIESNNIIS